MIGKILSVVIMISVALMFLLIALNNILDYCTNFKMLKTVVSMESISAVHMQWRAITSPVLQHSIYLSIIVWESLTAIVCWIGSMWLFSANESTLSYAKGKSVAVIGLAMGFSLFMIGFVVIAGEWFYLWDSSLNSMHSKCIVCERDLDRFIHCFF